MVVMLEVIVKYVPTGSLDNCLPWFEAVGWFCWNAKQTYYSAETDSGIMQLIFQWLKTPVLDMAGLMGLSLWINNSDCWNIYYVFCL